MNATRPTALPRSDRQGSDAHEIVSRLRGSMVYCDYEKSFETVTGLPLILRAAGSISGAVQSGKPANRLCALMAASNASCVACLRSQESVEMASEQKAQTQECFAGLNESAVPVRLGEQVIAYLQTVQVLFDFPTDAGAAAVVRRIRELDPSISESALQGLYRQSRVMERSRYDAIIRLLEIFSQHLSALSNQMMVESDNSELPSISRARAYIAEHQDEILSLQTVARSVGMSAFYFCKAFKKSTGLTFTDYLSRVRVETVKRLLLDPHTRISEAAFEAGFQSLSQFNRVFNRVVGESPSRFRVHLHESSRGRFSPQATVVAA